MSITMGYKMTHDRGFAPNPCHGVLTLATCKPKVRAGRRVGDWVAGFASQTLVNLAARKGLKIQHNGLVYLMQVGEVLPLDAYFEDHRFAVKRPPRESSDTVAVCGDNIYYRDHRGQYEQLENRSHPHTDMPHDTAGVNAPVAGRFYYFGRDCFVPDGGWAATTGAPLSTGRTFFCPEGFAEKLLRYFDEKGIAEGMHAAPALMNERTPVHSNPSPSSGSRSPHYPYGQASVHDPILAEAETSRATTSRKSRANYVRTQQTVEAPRRASIRR